MLFEIFNLIECLLLEIMTKCGVCGVRYETKRKKQAILNIATMRNKALNQCGNLCFNESVFVSRFGKNEELLCHFGLKINVKSIPICRL